MKEISIDKIISCIFFCYIWWIKGLFFPKNRIKKVEGKEVLGFERRNVAKVPLCAQQVREEEIHAIFVGFFW